MSKHRYQSEPYFIKILRQTLSRAAAMFSREKRQPQAFGRRSAAVSRVSARQTYRRPSAVVSRSGSRGTNHRRVFRINKRKMLIAGGAAAAIIVCTVLLVTLKGNPKQTAGYTGTDASSSAMRLADVTVVMPVSESVHIEQGTAATVVSDVQKQLMELGYMAADETDGVFDDQTAIAVNHFKAQHGLAADGVVDEAAYTLLMGGNAQYYTVSRGAQDTEDDTDVYELQQRLVELGYLNTATGTFGEDTEGAVKKFQKLNSIEQSGSIDQATREMLYAENAIANFYSSGEKSDEILDFQKRLKKLGYLTTEPDGNYGKDTKAAVQRFQEANGLIADGFLGPATQAALMSEEAKDGALKRGDNNAQVVNVQQKLIDLKYLKGKADGNFGPGTETAVRSFQYRNGLSVDGKVGAATLRALNSPNAKKSTGVSITGANVDSFISVAMSKRGCKYVGGGKGPTVFDCSGFVYWCLNQVGVKQGYMTSYTWRSCSKYTKITSMGGLKRGDIIVYKGHVAICAGNGYMIDASSHNKQVVKRKYTGSSYWKSNFICGYRIF